MIKSLPTVTSGQPNQHHLITGSNTEKLDYAMLEHAGKPHRVKTKDAEEIVRNNLDKINERLVRNGLRPIRLDDPAVLKL